MAPSTILSIFRLKEIDVGRQFLFFIHHTQYFTDVLIQFNIQDCNPTATLEETHIKFFNLDENDPNFEGACRQ